MNKTFLAFLTLSSCLYGNKINIALAANVSYAIKDLKKEFQKEHKNTKVVFTIGSSGKLSAQIKNGAKYDIFMSANMLYPNTLYKKGLSISKPIVYAKGALILLSNKKHDLNKGLNILEEENIKKIAIANIKTAPYGIAAYEALQNTKLYAKIKNKLVYAESVGQALVYTLKATNIGFIAKSALYSSKLKRFKDNKNYLEINPSLYNPINQGMLLLKNAQNNEKAKAFFDFMQSFKAKEILKTYGYLINE